MVACAREIKARENKVEISGSGRHVRMDREALATPIPDVRHRSVNLVAPYLVNVRKMDENAAADRIVEYIERCKLLDPNTKVNETYVRYQCRYAKNKGMRPLSLVRAKELFRGIVEFD